MRTLSQIKDEIAIEVFGVTYDLLDNKEKVAISDAISHKYTREAIAEHLERKVTDDEINMAEMIDSTGRDINQPGEIWKRAIKWYKSKINEKAQIRISPQ